MDQNTAKDAEHQDVSDMGATADDVERDLLLPDDTWPVVKEELASEADDRSIRERSDEENERMLEDVPEGAAATTGADNDGSAENSAHPRHLWYKAPSRTIPDAFGYGGIPAFWFTLNLPFNYLYEIHRSNMHVPS